MTDSPATRHGKVPTMVDVAAVAGVSPQTVSRVSNGSPNVEASTRTKVLEAMRSVGYRPNAAARALTTGRFGAIGVVAFSLSRFGDVKTVEALALAAKAHGFSSNLISLDSPTAGGVSAAMAQLAAQNVDGLIVVESEILERSSVMFAPGIPVVVTDDLAETSYPLVMTDQASGVTKAVEHLLRLGHKTVWHIAGPPSGNATRVRREAWEAALVANGAPVPPVYHGDWTPASGYRLGAVLADRIPEEITAILCANDQMALGLMRAFQERGISIPGDVSVAGFDDIDVAEYVWPPLTTVRQHFDQVGQLCMDLLLEQIAGRRPTPGKVHDVPVELVIRASTSVPPAHRS